MTVDTEKLTSALSTNFTGVKNLFEYNLSSDNAALSTFKRTNGLAVSSFTLNIDTVAKTYTASYTDANGATQTTTLTGTAISGGGVSLTGQAGSVLDGLQLLYSSSVTNPSPIHVSVTQGIGDRLYNALDSFINTTSGIVTNAVSNLTTKENNNTTKIDAITAQVATYKDQITAQYSQLEAALSKANNLLSLLDAQQKARSSNG